MGQEGEGKGKCRGKGRVRERGGEEKGRETGKLIRYHIFVSWGRNYLFLSVDLVLHPAFQLLAPAENHQKCQYKSFVSVKTAINLSDFCYGRIQYLLPSWRYDIPRPCAESLAIPTYRQNGHWVWLLEETTELNSTFAKIMYYFLPLLSCICVS
jgi:hypothetical protein